MAMGTKARGAEVMNVIIKPATDVESTGPAISSPPAFHIYPSPVIESVPKSPLARIMTPLTSPMKKAITNMQGYLEEIGHLTKLDPQESWLPITESRNGNAYYAAFHTLSSGIGVQALLLPLAFTSLGW